MDCLGFIYIITRNLKILTPRLKETLWERTKTKWNKSKREWNLHSKEKKLWSFMLRIELITTCLLFYRTFMQKISQELHCDQKQPEHRYYF